jgi:hypothetical protein
MRVSTPAITGTSREKFVAANNWQLGAAGGALNNPLNLTDHLGLSPGGCVGDPGQQCSPRGLTGLCDDSFGNAIPCSQILGGPSSALFGSLVYDLPGFQNPSAEALQVYIKCLSNKFQCDANGDYYNPDYQIPGEWPIQPTDHKLGEAFWACRYRKPRLHTSRRTLQFRTFLRLNSVHLSLG